MPCHIECLYFFLDCDSADIALVIDSSASITPDAWNEMKIFLKQLVDQFDIGPNKVRIGIIIYASSAYIEVHLDQYDTATGLKMAIDNLQRRGYLTATDQALNLLTNQFFRNTGRAGVDQVAILFTDGASDEPQRTSQAATDAKANGIRLLVVGISNLVEDYELRDIASNPTYDVFRVEEFSELVNSVNNISKRACIDIKEERGEYFRGHYVKH